VDAEDEGSEGPRVAALFRETADHSLLAERRFYLEPGAAALPREITAVGQLRHDAFEPPLSDRLEESTAMFANVLAELYVGQVSQNGGKKFLTAHERQIAQVVAIQIEQVEDVIDTGAFTGILVVLQKLKLRLAAFVQHDDFAVEHRFMSQVLQGSDDGRKSFRERELVA